MKNESIETHIEKNFNSNALDECEKLIERMRIKFDPEYNPKIQKRDYTFEEMREAAIAMRIRNRDYTFEEMREAALANRARNFGKNELRFDNRQQS